MKKCGECKVDMIEDTNLHTDYVGGVNFEDQIYLSYVNGTEKVTNMFGKEKEKNNMLCTIITVFAVIAVIVATVLVAYKFLKRRPIEEFEYDFDDDFDDSFSMDSLDSELEDEEYPQATIIEE